LNSHAIIGVQLGGTFGRVAGYREGRIMRIPDAARLQRGESEGLFSYELALLL
jgi:hypothetical protein